MRVIWHSPNVRGEKQRVRGIPQRLYGSLPRRKAQPWIPTFRRTEREADSGSIRDAPSHNLPDFVVVTDATQAVAKTAVVTQGGEKRVCLKPGREVVVADHLSLLAASPRVAGWAAMRCGLFRPWIKRNTPLRSPQQGVSIFLLGTFPRKEKARSG